MRSEKEIRKQLNANIKIHTEISKGREQQALYIADKIQEVHDKTLEWVLEGLPRYTLKEAEEKGLILPLHDLKKGVEYRKRLLKFIKEPHYSIAELEKILKSIGEDHSNKFIIDTLKDKKEVEEILDG